MERGCCLCCADCWVQVGEAEISYAGGASLTIEMELLLYYTKSRYFTGAYQCCFLSSLRSTHFFRVLFLFQTKFHFLFFPFFCLCTVPVEVSVSLTQLSGRLLIYGEPVSVSSNSGSHQFSLSFAQPPKCDFHVNVNVRAKQKSWDVASKFSKIADFVISMLKKLLAKNSVFPNRIQLTLPMPGSKMTIQTVALTSRRSSPSSASSSSSPTPS